ncbi:E3 ubiquitin-protein ligase PUB23-like [Benincasa hispida]|uniref:E3 ubiquitin-protein ligase PUB23-like n=1 Tax=Benincasa hispida TaxID=102211 RepID=UPI0018FF3E22|nr:E3 ubiquitin-protein ligase PUB23-like [Benincasa hispida]
MKMEEENNDGGIEVPSYFLCPISLQLMRDPVTISTGITYDRSNIEKWLFSCNKRICPITKQPLSPDPDLLTPNHTLRRLIQSWCTLNASHGIERIPTPKSPIDKTHVAKILKEAQNFPNSNQKCLLALKAIVLESERNRNLVAQSDGVFEFLTKVIKSGGSNNIGSIESAVEILFHIKPSQTHLKNLVNGDSNFINSLTFVLQNGNCQSRAYAVMLLKSSLELADPIRLMGIEKELLSEIVRVIHDHISHQASKSALKVLAEVCPWGRNRVKAVEGGAVQVLVELLLNSSERRWSELGLVVLDQLCGCAEGREKLVEHGAGVAVVSKKILRVSAMASDRAVRILSSICRFSASVKVVQEMLEVGVVAKLCLVLQMDCSLKTREKARDILKLHSRVWSNSSCIPPHLLSAYPSS